MAVYTNQPSLQFYSGNWLTGTPDRQGRPYRDYDGFCLEAQQFARQPERPALGDPWLLPGQRYRHQTRYRFIPAPDSPARQTKGRARRHVMAAPALMAPPNQPGEARPQVRRSSLHISQGTAP